MQAIGDAAPFLWTVPRVAIITNGGIFTDVISTLCVFAHISIFLYFLNPFELTLLYLLSFGQATQMTLICLFLMMVIVMDLYTALGVTIEEILTIAIVLQ